MPSILPPPVARRWGRRSSSRSSTPAPPPSSGRTTSWGDPQWTTRRISTLPGLIRTLPFERAKSKLRRTTPEAPQPTGNVNRGPGVATARTFRRISNPPGLIRTLYPFERAHSKLRRGVAAVRAVHPWRISTVPGLIQMFPFERAKPKLRRQGWAARLPGQATDRRQVNRRRRRRLPPRSPRPRANAPATPVLPLLLRRRAGETASLGRSAGGRGPYKGSPCVSGSVSSTASTRSSLLPLAAGRSRRR